MPLQSEKGNHLLKLSDLSAAEMRRILAKAQELKEKNRRQKSHFPLQGKTLGLIFEHSSTRTRVAFQVGMTQLGGNSLFLTAKDTQMGRGEPMADTARVLSRYVNGIAARLDRQEDLEELAKYATIPVINGLTQLYHPCQILADLLTVQEQIGEWEKVKIAYIGDVNNVCNSWVEAAAVLGLTLTVCCPEAVRPSFETIVGKKKSTSKIRWEKDPREGVKGAAVLSTDVWVSMGSADSAEKKTLLRPYQVNAELLKCAQKDAIVLHCLPAHRGEEITAEVLEGPHSKVFDQAENKLHVQKAVLELCMT